jgi:hypothetical protein
MKRNILTILAFSIVCMLNQQTLQARSETSREMERGAARGEEKAGPVGAAVGGLFGAGVGLTEDTGNWVTGDDRYSRDNHYYHHHHHYHHHYGDDE